MHILVLKSSSIPANAIAIVRSEKTLFDHGDVKVRKLNEEPLVFSESKKILELIYAFRHGVRAQNEEFGIPDVRR